MEIVFLRGGDKCALHQKLDNNEFLVERYEEFQCYESGDYAEELSGVRFVVKEIFSSAPTTSLENSVKNLLEQQTTLAEEVMKLKGEKAQLDYQLANIKKTVIDKEKFIIDRSEILNAKEIVVFTNEGIMPIRKSDQMYGFRLVLTYEVRTGEEVGWSYTLYHEDGRFDYGKHIDKQDGYLINPTEDEVDAIIFSRVERYKDKLHMLERVPEKYLSDEIKVALVAEKKDKNKKELERIESQINHLLKRKEKFI